DEFLQKLNDYVENGGHVLYTFKDGVANEHVKVRTTRQPGIITKAVGAHYEMFVDPNGEGLADNSGIFKGVDNQISNWAELLESDGAKVLATYDHHWKSYAAITENKFGQGMTWYLGCWPNEEF
ncbi:beta-galactosidase trimerization domain-containing protein, partial [Mordavella massiliensis]|uniref:beta-galactosidase trimerization domain-containing protein n=2 Tax=Bacillota TaxID=1239 RepID=UPI00210D0EFD|nr:beta-galactosidase trimerization domain-containing protein [Mordavella massiliensis]